MKSSKGVGVLVVILFLGVIAGLILWGWKQSQNHNSSDNKSTGRVSISGRIDSIDLSAMSSDGNGVLKVSLPNDSLVEVDVASGESDCDSAAIKIPDLSIGDVVEVTGDQDSAGIVHICNAGTSIAKDPN